MTTLYHAVSNAHRHSEQPCFTFRSVSLSYEQCFDAVDALATTLSEKGVQQGQRVGIYLPKCGATALGILACIKIGAVVVPINPILKPEQVKFIVNNSGASIFISQQSQSTVLNEVGALQHVELIATIDSITSLDFNYLDSHPNVNGLQSPINHTTQPDDLAAILYTSGSTGQPKGVMLTQENILIGTRSVAEYLQLSERDTILALLPFSFDYGLNQLFSGLLVGAHIILQDFLLVNDVIKTISKYQVTGLAGVPPLWHKLSEGNWTDDSTQSLRYWTNSGGVLPKPLLSKLKSIFGNAKPYLMYGLTEAFRSTYLPPDQLELRPTSIGKAIPNAEIFVLNKDGHPTKPNEHGELVHCGPLVSPGYWQEPEASAQRFKPAPSCATLPSLNGTALWSGDTAYADESGYLYFVGRTDDLIKTSGYRVSSEEVEDAAYQIEAIAEAVAVGIEHPTLGQEIMLCTTLKGDQQIELADILSLMTKALPTYMVPAQVLLFDQLPRNPNGKFDRPAIKQAVEAKQSSTT